MLITIIKDFTYNERLKQKITVLKRRKNSTTFELDLNKYCRLAPGEYNITFKCISQDTPLIPIEVYEKKKRVHFDITLLKAFYIL